MEKPQNESKEKNSSALDFSGLILGFSSAALYHIGETEIDQQRAKQPNFELAEQNISIIRMLQDKTKGNLTTAETKLVENVLNDLEVKYKELRNKA